MSDSYLFFVSIFIFIGIPAIFYLITMRKYIGFTKVEGCICGFEEEEEIHYIIFSFVTKEGKSIKGREYGKEKGNKIVATSLESLFPLDEVEEYLNTELPITGVEILYDPSNPENFLARWL